MANDFQHPRIVARDDGMLYVAQFITPRDVEKFKEVVAKDFPNDSALLNTYDEHGKGSSVFGNIVMTGVLLESGWNIADLPQESEATEQILNQIGDKSLTKTTKGGFLENPLSFPFAGLTLKANGPMQGYSIELTPQAKFFASPQYSEKNNGSIFYLFDADGNPILNQFPMNITEAGKHTLHINDNVFVRVYASGGLGLSAGGDSLRDSNGNGRVVKYRAVGTEKNLAAKLAQDRNTHFNDLTRIVHEEHAAKLKSLEAFKSTLFQ